MAHQSDIYWLGVAAEQSLIPYTVKRNPRVGAVVVDKSGLAIAKGFHEGYGSAHAEQVVLEKLKGRAKGATLYVNLAPCNHVGKRLLAVWKLSIEESNELFIRMPIPIR